MIKRAVCSYWCSKSTEDLMGDGGNEKMLRRQMIDLVMCQKHV